jgi:hypothetical protein
MNARLVQRSLSEFVQSANTIARRLRKRQVQPDAQPTGAQAVRPGGIVCADKIFAVSLSDGRAAGMY